jgi:uncharacterized protein (DUF1810 family)
VGSLRAGRARRFMLYLLPALSGRALSRIFWEYAVFAEKNHRSCLGVLGVDANLACLRLA